VTRAGDWARVAAEFDCELTVVSSDGIFTGPWMFHRENGTCYCEDPPARFIRLQEQEVTAVCPDVLVVRTNVFGVSPLPGSGGLIEAILEALQEGLALSLDCMRHATPILATDFADILERAWQHRLQGVYHLAGGERINPFRLACLLADEFGLSPAPLTAVERGGWERREFAAGETSLQTRRLRKTLEVPLPLVREGLARLHEQWASGYRDRFNAPASALTERVA
jgi:dTDP-4-dehydrorhamnose reductase